MTFADPDSPVERARSNVSRAALGVASVLLGVGVILGEAGSSTTSLATLEFGIGILLVIPILNAIAALLEEIGRRDWPFVAAGLLVMSLVAYSVLEKVK